MRFHTRSNQSGFALIEVIASAAVLGLVTLAVYGGYNATLHSSGRERARAVAASLAEQDQERLRSFRPTDLANYAAPPQIIKVPAVTGVPYTVTSTVDWISDSADGSTSCASEANLEDYLRITSRVTSGIIGKQTLPVIQRSLVAPPVGTFRKGVGTLVVRVTGKGAVPITSLPVRIQQGATTVIDDTNSFGCAVFRYVPVGTYSVSFSRPGYVTTNGVNLATDTATVSEGTLNLINELYDRGATVLSTFDFKHRSSACTPPACPVSRSTAVTLESSSLPAPQYKTFPAGATNQSAWQTSITSQLLYPFDSAYGVYGGTCTGANPSTLIAPPVALSPVFAKNPTGLDPGQLLYPVKLRMPALNVRVINGAGAANIVHNRPINATPESINCTTGQLKFMLRGFSGTGSGDTNRGWASKFINVAAGGYDPGLPYGNYDICADNGSRRTDPLKFKAALNSPDGSTVTFAGPPAATVTTIDLSLSAHAENGTCPA